MRSFLTSALVILSIVSLGQNSYQIVDTTKTWNTIGIGYITWGVAVCGGTTTNRFRNISNPGDQYLDVLECRDSIQQEWSYEGLIREDALNKQVFYKYGETEGLIYDFSLETGDTVYIDNQYLNYNDTVSLVVDSTDIADVFGVIRKRLFLSGLDLSVRDRYYPDEIWIEGIGSNYGIMHSGLGGIAVGGGTDKLLCASQNDNTIYMDSLFHECYIETFYPQILQEYFDTAYVDTYYELQLQVDTGNATSFALIGELIPAGFSFDPTTGLLTGTPTLAGSFPCTITAMDSVMNWFTDIIYEDIVVVLPTGTSYTDKPKYINIYPNPFNTVLNIDVAGPENQECLLEIYTSDGNLIRKFVFNGSIKPDLSGLSNGLYLVRILDSDGNVLFIERIVKGN